MRTAESKHIWQVEKYSRLYPGTGSVTSSNPAGWVYLSNKSLRVEISEDVGNRGKMHVQVLVGGKTVSLELHELSPQALHTSGLTLLQKENVLYGRYAAENATLKRFQLKFSTSADFHSFSVVLGRYVHIKPVQTRAQTLLDSSIASPVSTPRAPIPSVGENRNIGMPPRRDVSLPEGLRLPTPISTPRTISQDSSASQGFGGAPTTYSQNRAVFNSRFEAPSRMLFETDSQATDAPSATTFSQLPPSSRMSSTLLSPVTNYTQMRDFSDMDSQLRVPMASVINHTQMRDLSDMNSQLNGPTMVQEDDTSSETQSQLLSARQPDMGTSITQSPLEAIPSPAIIQPPPPSPCTTTLSDTLGQVFRDQNGIVLEYLSEAGLSTLLRKLLRGPEFRALLATVDFERLQTEFRRYCEYVDMD
ncbi:uncharacterized protein EV422DRAFT_544110 [Fimicolochytrium jonesii]|uniref:uncharacterized protein n=1 Tax=Fimicolochytrium jonesii TaxID=1396493 RepID=UPI0022FEA4AA|nr:uncharacterized protein EV422DRAFT_544110 [Fimicolochytrium jonesii]KAI8816819.1 hypothetical protein EV422DRAFT_544110 [Fimicolochytrium jonesii]